MTLTPGNMYRMVEFRIIGDEEGGQDDEVYTLSLEVCVEM